MFQNYFSQIQHIVVLCVACQRRAPLSFFADIGSFIFRTSTTRRPRRSFSVRCGNVCATCGESHNVWNTRSSWPLLSQANINWIHLPTFCSSCAHFSFAGTLCADLFCSRTIMCMQGCTGGVFRLRIASDIRCK